MVIEHLPDTRASRAWHPHNPWPIIITVMTILGAIGGRIVAQH